MSFKIFSLQLLGKIKPVETIEARRKQLFDDFVEFQQVERSDELKKYLELESEVNSAGFKKKKEEIESLKFKGSRECNLLKEFSGLQKKNSLKDFFKIEGSADLQRYTKLKTAEKFTEFFGLKKYVTEGAFAKEKKEILAQIFKGSTEEKQWKEFLKLENSNKIKAWVELQNPIRLKEEEGKKHSKKLRLFKDGQNSQSLKRYIELKALVNSDAFKKRSDFLKDKTKFEKSETSKKYQKFKQLESDNDIIFFIAFEKSKLYKNYLAVKDSAELKRYRELNETTASTEFLERKRYLEDPKKWEKTDEYKRQQQWLEMKKLPHLIKYFKNKGTSVFDFHRNWEIAFADDFSASKIDTEKWRFTSYVANKMLGDNYSLTGDLHFFTKGNNVKTGKNLTIEVRKEKAAGRVWKTTAGFVPAELEYTSGLVSTWNSFDMEDGIFEAKIKFEPVHSVVSSFYLAGNQDLPRVNLLEMGIKNRVGVLTLNYSKANVDGLDIANLKTGQWYIFSIEKLGSNIAWKINETEVFASQYQGVKGKLHVSASSLVVEEIPASQLPVPFEIEWVKCWRKKQ
jgi:hypothetical protein